MLEEARRCLGERHYWLSCFMAQQAAEFYLKALLISMAGVYPFTHDLVVLLDALKELGIDIPGELYTIADALTPHYTMARYPGRKPVKYDKGLGERCVRYAERIAGWVEGQASQEDG